MSEPKIYKTSVYNGNAVYNGDSVYNCNGVYNDGYCEFVEIGGKKYPVVIIGTKKWIAKNLDYNFGIDFNKSNVPVTPCCWYYEYADSFKFGMLYNWYAVNYLEQNKNNLLPDGWRVANKTDWEELYTIAGGDSVAGYQLKSKTEWDEGGNGLGKYGIDIKPGGFRSNSGVFGYTGRNGSFWSCTQYNSNDAYWFSCGMSNSLNHGTGDKRDGDSVRLVLDI